MVLITSIVIRGISSVFIEIYDFDSQNTYFTPAPDFSIIFVSHCRFVLCAQFDDPKFKYIICISILAEWFERRM